GKVTAAINANGSGIDLTDHSSGGNTFQVLIANNSTASTVLGILRPDAQQGETPDGVVKGATIADLTPLDRFFLKDVGASISLHLTTPDDGGGTGADGTGNLTADKVTSVTITHAGSGYASAPNVIFIGGGGKGAKGHATISG